MSSLYQDLPAGLGHTGNHAGVGKLAESDTGKVETAQESVATTSELATVHETHGGSVARQHRQTDVVAFSLQLGAEVCITSRDSCLLLVSFNPAFLCHNFVGGVRCDAVTNETYQLIVNSADVVKGIFTAHWHNDMHLDIVAKNNKGETTVIPQFIHTASAYDDGHVMRITVK